MKKNAKTLELLADALRECFIDLQNLSSRLVSMFTEVQRMVNEDTKAESQIETKQLPSVSISEETKDNPGFFQDGLNQAPTSHSR